MTLESVAEETGLEVELIERILVMMGTPVGHQRNLTAADAVAIRLCAQVLAAGFPLVAFLQLVRVYVQSLRRIAEAEVRLFHLYVHEPLIRDGVPELQMAEAMGDLAAEIMPLAAPLTEYLHNRYLALLHRAGRGRPYGDRGRTVDRRNRARPRRGDALLHRPHRLHPLHRGGGRHRGARRGRELRRDGRGDAAARGDDREDDRRRGDGGLPRRGRADRVGGRLPRPLRPPAAAAGRHPLRRRRLPRRRLLRQPGQPRPPDRQPGAGGGGAGHRPGRGERSTPGRGCGWSRSARSRCKGFPVPTALFVVRAAED